MDRNRYFSCHNLKNTVGKKSLGMPENMQFGWKTLSPVAFLTVDSKKVVSDQFHLCSTLVETECIKRKMRLWK